MGNADLEAADNSLLKALPRTIPQSSPTRAPKNEASPTGAPGRGEAWGVRGSGQCWRFRVMDVCRESPIGGRSFLHV